jgi:hypothetical protein
VGGRLANPTTAFYEDKGFAPIHAQLSGGTVLFFKGASKVYSVSLSSLSATDDYFVMETFQDNGHTIIALWGINAPGTMASGVYYDSQFTNLTTLTAGNAFIVHWQGATPNTPLPTDTFTIVYSSQP